MAVILFVALSLVAYRFWLIPLAEDMVLLDLEARQQEWERRIDEEETRRALEREAEAARRDVDRRAARVEESVPRRLHPEETMATIRDWAEEASIEVRSLSAGPVEPSPPFVRSTLRLRARGTYGAHSRLLGRIASELPLTTVDELTLEAEEPVAGPLPDPGARNTPDIPLILDLRLSLYAEEADEP